MYVDEKLLAYAAFHLLKSELGAGNDITPELTFQGHNSNFGQLSSDFYNLD